MEMCLGQFSNRANVKMFEALAPALKGECITKAQNQGKMQNKCEMCFNRKVLDKTKNTYTIRFFKI